MLIEQQTIKGKPILIKLWRDSSTHNRQFQIITDYRPYFFIESDNEFESEFKTINGENLKKIKVFNPYDINDLKRQYDQTWEVNISYPHKYILDNIEVPMKKGWNRILYWDIETNTSKNDSFPDPTKAPHEIIEICIYDNLKKEYHHFTTEHQTEYEMLKQFINYVRECNFDIAIAEPEMMKELTKIAKILGPKGLMPSPKAGTIGLDVPGIIKELRRGKITFKNDAGANLHQAVAKISWDLGKIKENIKEYLNIVKKAKPAGAKGVFIKKVFLCSTMGPALKITI